VSQPAVIQRTVTSDGIEIAYETFGRASDPPVVLIMGLGTQMLGWPDGFCRELAGRGYFVVRFDNRDVGLSTHLHDAPRPNPVAAWSGDLSSASYTLSDMAADSLALLDALGLDSAHIAGASMGGMIAQTLAIEHPERVRSLTSIMSSTGSAKVGQSTQAAMAVLMAPPVGSRPEAMDRAVANYRVIGSPGYQLDEEAVRERAGLSYDRAYDPFGVGRQLVAILASGDRTQRLRDVRVPTLIIHGEQDPLVNISGGRATAAAIPGAELVVLDGMGHDLPQQLWAAIADAMAALVKRATDQARS
jgi:pimeloyl-ACP methyl ester carboxylesterase